MAEATLIKEFLVGLGFKTDEASLKKFNDGINGATKAVGRLVVAITGASLAVAAGIAAFTSNLEELYFVSKRTGASVLNIKAMDLAARDLGASSQEARGALEGLASFMRNTPNAEGFLKNMGVQTRDAKGHLLDTSDILIRMGQRFAQLQKTNPGMAKAYAGMFGISENMELAMMDPHFAQIIRKYRTQNKGTHWNKEAVKAHDQMDKLREMQSKMDALKMRVGSDMEKISDMVLPKLEKLLDFIIRLDNATNGWSTDIGLLAGAFLALLGPIGRVVKALTGLGGPRAGAAVAGGEGAAAAAGAGAAAKRGLIGRILMNPYVAGLAAMFHSDKLNKGEDAQTAKWHTTLGRAKDAVQFFVDRGWTHAQASGIVANLLKESGLNPRIKGDSGAAYGIGQWHKDRQDAFKRWAGHDIHQASLQEQLAFVQYELTKGAEHKAGALLRAARNARQAGQVVSYRYERPRNADAEAAARGEIAVKLEQKTEVHVHGSHDPHATGHAVAKEQSRVNNDLVRNLQGAYQ